MLEQGKPVLHETDERITKSIMFLRTDMLKYVSDDDLDVLTENNCVMVTDSESNILCELSHNSELGVIKVI